MQKMWLPSQVGVGQALEAHHLRQATGIVEHQAMLGGRLVLTIPNSSKLTLLAHSSMQSAQPVALTIRPASDMHKMHLVKNQF